MACLGRVSYNGIRYRHTRTDYCKGRKPAYCDRRNAVSHQSLFFTNSYLRQLWRVFRRVHWNNRGKKSIVWRCVSRLENTGLFCDARNVLDSTICSHEPIFYNFNASDLLSNPESPCIKAFYVYFSTLDRVEQWVTIHPLIKPYVQFSRIRLSDILLPSAFIRTYF